MAFNHNKNKSGPLQGIIDSIKKANSLKDVLVPEAYALPFGWADKAAKNLNKQTSALNTNQLRKFLSELKSIDLVANKDNYDQYKHKIFLLMPQIAYAHGRKIVNRDFYNLMKECITPTKLKTYDDFKAFVNFYVAIVAYFK